MAGYCTSVWPYFHEPQASENTAQECNIQPYYLLTHQIKVVAACIFNELLAAGLFLALDGTSIRTNPSTSGRKYRKSVNNAVFIHNESLFVVSAAAMSIFQLKHIAVAKQHMPCGL